MEQSPRPVRETDELHRGRVSIPGARYFITVVTQQRKPWLEESGVWTALDVLKAWHLENVGGVLAAMVMPDHIHVLFTLGPKLTVGQTIARWKTEIRKRIGYREDFQRDFWEHMLRKTEDIEEYALYIFLNPYRAGLLPPDRTWPGWWAPDPGLFKFSGLLLGEGTPPPEWIEWTNDYFSRLAHGE